MRKDKNTYHHFDAATVPLSGSNLIEASAGTGKTYSIALLVLRMVLELQLSVKEILMVTFTKAAVAELQERVRRFIRQAYKASIGEIIKDNTISQLVQQAMDTYGAEAVQERLKDAVLLLDETSVLTIHSFCQQTLSEFAFETNQLFGMGILQDAGTVVADKVNDFWRQQVTTLPVPVLERLLAQGFSIEGITRLVNEELAGKKYMGNQEAELSALDADAYGPLLAEMDKLEKEEEDLHQQLLQYIVANQERIKADTEGNTHARKNMELAEAVGVPEKLVQFVAANKGKGYIGKVYGDIVEKIAACEKLQDARKLLMGSILFRLHCLAIREVKEGVTAFKQHNNLLAFDDMIISLHQALMGRNSAPLIAALQKKYKAVFIDEFQDTDRQQYEIFEKAFGTGTILFYIGDPKQSIYGWRKADIFTYFKAREGVEHLYSMNHNYRSAPMLIAAMNTFFLPAADFDTFYFSGEPDGIEYIHVEAPANATPGYVCKGKEEEPPVSIFAANNKPSIAAAVAAQVLELLQYGGYSIQTAAGERCITPADIGILVRSGQEGRDVKAQLAIHGIPAVAIDDAKVLRSEEAKYVLYLMEAMAAPDRSVINRALLSPFTGFTIDTILLLDDESTLGLFSRYKEQWQADGIYTALMSFVTDFEVRKHLLQAHTEYGERIITNLLQLIELVHQVQSRKNLSGQELLAWLKKGIEGMETEGDEYEQRVESDEEAVKIVTIHKSKGLEYNIVLAPYLDFTNGSHEVITFRDPATGEYISAERNRLTEEQLCWQQRQAEQENRRLLYVAITRAVYKCYIYRNTYHKNSTLASFLLALKEAPPALIHFEEGLPEPGGRYYTQKQAAAPFTPAAAVHFTLLHENWRRMSYTMLAGTGLKQPKSRALPVEDAYETFMFQGLRRGAKTGNLLHFIFERVNFADESRWEQVLAEAVRRFLPGQQEQYLPMLQRMLQEVLQTPLEVGGTIFSLSAVAPYKRIAEFEFDFPVQAFTPEWLNSLANEQMNIEVKQFSDWNQRELEGIMNGKMDLFFEHEGKYYILDWKSNYLGGTQEEYNTAALAAAMNESNYHLQYLLYTVAAKKYLESRLGRFDYDRQFGGVIYLFVRGVRNNSNTGIFTTRPDKVTIQKLEEYLHVYS